MNQTNEPLSIETIHTIFERMNQHQIANEPNTVTIPSAEYAKLKEDAARWQCIRELDWIDDNIMIVYHINQDSPETLDNAIDEAIEEGK